MGGIGIKWGILSRLICRNFRRRKMVNFLGDTRIERKKSVGDSFAIWPLRRYGSFFFFSSFFKYYNNWWLLMRYFSSFALSRGREPKSIPPFCSFTRLSCSNIMFINFFLYLQIHIYIYFLMDRLIVIVIWIETS